MSAALVVAMLFSRNAYRFWHDGTGSIVVALVSVAASVVPIILRVERGACRAGWP